MAGAARKQRCFAQPGRDSRESCREDARHFVELHRAEVRQPGKPLPHAEAPRLEKRNSGGVEFLRPEKATAGRPEPPRLVMTKSARAGARQWGKAKSIRGEAPRLFRRMSFHLWRTAACGPKVRNTEVSMLHYP